jgi:hypothetical protein
MTQNEVMAGELEPEDYEAGTEREKAQKVGDHFPW